MNNQQLTEMVERLNGQLVTLSQMEEATRAAHELTAQALSDLRDATDVMSQAMDVRIQACEGDLE